MLETNLNPDRKELRKFGLLFGAVLIVLFGLLLPWWKTHPLPRWPYFVGVPFIVLALVWPAILRFPYIGWMKFGAVTVPPAVTCTVCDPGTKPEAVAVIIADPAGIALNV